MPLSILKNIPLFQYTTFKIGGPANFFVIVKDDTELLDAIRWAKQKHVKYFVLGGGSNILISDKGFRGLVIKLQNTKYRVQDTRLSVDAGMPLGQAIGISLRHNLTGLEWASGIPGTVGGAVRGNAGSFGGDISQITESVIVLENNMIRELDAKDIQFGYRHSFFKPPRNKKIILRVTFMLSEGNAQKSKELVTRYIETKKNTQALEYPSAGCVFKNYQLKKKDKKLLQEYPELRNIVKNNIIPTGWLIEQCGLKGEKVGGAMVSSRHANFIVNINAASSRDVIQLIRIIKGKVGKKFSIRLEEEIAILP